MTRSNSPAPLYSEATPAVRTVVLLPEADTYVDPDPGNATKSFAGCDLVVSSDKNKPGKVAYVRFDLGPIPPTATITACQLYFTVVGPVAKQVVTLLLVADDTWQEDITFEKAPVPSTDPDTVHIGTWGVDREPRVTSPVINPLLVARVQSNIRSGTDRKLSFQISSTFGVEASPVCNSYYSFATANKAGKYDSAPRLVVEYRPAAQPLARDWEQRQANARHSGRSPWIFANTPTSIYRAPPPLSGGPLSSPAILRDQLLYLFTQSALCAVDPATNAQMPLVTGLNEFQTLALGPDGLLYAAAKSGELAAFDLAAGGKKTISVPLTNLLFDITAGADGSVYLIKGSTTLVAYVRRLETFKIAWSKNFSEPAMSQPTLSADGKVAYIATAKNLYALHTADGREIWSYLLQSTATHFTTPVAGGANGLSYFGVDDKLYVFKDINTPFHCFAENAGTPVNQPTIGANDVLYVLQGTELYTVSPDGASKESSVSIPGLQTSAAITPLMDGAGNLYIIDNLPQLFVYKPDLTLGNTPQQLPSGFIASPTRLQLAPNGSLFIQSQSEVFRLEPGVAENVSVSSYSDGASYRAAFSLVLKGAAIPAAASIVFQSGGTISIEPGFSAPVGAELAFNTGY